MKTRTVLFMGLLLSAHATAEEIGIGNDNDDIGASPTNPVQTESTFQSLIDDILDLFETNTTGHK